MKQRQRKRERPVSVSSGMKRKDTSPDAGLPVANKKQILGFFLAILGVLLLLSIISYSNSDQSRLESFNISDILKKENQTANYTTSNWLGIAGVIISDFFVRDAFGYFSSVIPLLFIVYGAILLRKKKILESLQLSIYMIMLMILASTASGMLRITIGKQKIPYSLSGTSGEYLSSVLYFMIGALGSYFLLFGLIIVFSFLLMDRDIVTSAARIKMFIETARGKFRASLQEMRERRELERAREIQAPSKHDVPRKSKYSEPEEPQIKDTKIIRPDEDTVIPAGPGKDEEAPARKEIQVEEEPADVPPGKSGVKPAKFTGEDEPNVQEELDDFRLPPLELLNEPLREELELIPDDELKENGRLLQAKLLNFGVKIEKVIATPGPVVTLYELIPAEDVKLSRIESLEDDIALAMKARGIRMIIPIPGKGTVGVEIPNHKPSIVKIRGVLASKRFNDVNYQLPIALGKTISGEIYIDDLARMPHLLIAGSTGSGKSVGINILITSLLYKLHPNNLKFVLIDPKKIELTPYSKLRNHYLAVSNDHSEDIVTTPQNSVNVLKSLELEMEKRYERLANATVRNIYDYNRKFSEGKLKDDENIRHGRMPYIIVIIDELADLMITAAGEVEDPIARLAQLARAVGIHLVLATQRPSVDVITGVIKANFSARVAYLVNSKVDSRTILDMNGAEQLIGQGDMLYLPPGVAKPLRIQSPFINADEVDKVTDFISSQRGFSKPYGLPSVIAAKKKSMQAGEDRDELFEDAARVIVRYQQGSVSLLQRKLKVGYARAARIVDELESAGIVGPFDGSKAREVLVETEEELETLL